MFSFENKEIEYAFRDLVASTDGTEPCREEWDNQYDSKTDIWVETWSKNREVSKEQAEALCAPNGIKCHVYEKCKVYAMLAHEPLGVWGGTVPSERKKQL